MSDYYFKNQLTTKSGTEFFGVLQELLKLKIPVTLKNVLTFNHYDTIFTLSEFDADSINEIQECMRNVFDMDMLDDEEIVADYLGKFTKAQGKFILVSGEIRLIKCMAKTCQRLFALQPEEVHSREDSVQPDEIEADRSDLLKTIREWLLAAKNLTQILMQELDLNITPRNKSADGSRTYLMDCPVLTCQFKFKIAYKGYRQYYKHKKVSTKPIKIAKSRWHWGAMKQHLLHIHGDQSCEERDSTPQHSRIERRRNSCEESSPTNIDESIPSENRQIETAPTLDVDQIDASLTLAEASSPEKNLRGPSVPNEHLKVRRKRGRNVEKSTTDENPIRPHKTARKMAQKLR